MCGLAGFVLNAPIERPLAEQRLQAMAASLRHRGPDDHGIWSDGLAGLAFARLAIIDLSAAGHQPMSSGDGQVWLTFNGEIYNFQELRAELVAKGHKFRSRSDTEVILCGYLAWGDDVLQRLRGMFAIALWDRRSRRLLLARDRIGKKPLNYALTDEGLLFGSEMKAILEWPGIPREADLGALHHFLTYQYVPAPLTAFRAIKKLPAAHKMAVTIDQAGRLSPPQIECYWRLPSPRPRYRPIDIDEAADELTHRLEECVRIRMISDVPLGAFLSGGVDSSSVVAMMARQGGGKVKTFSIGFENPEYDETRYARMVAERYETEHHEMVVHPDAVEILPKLVHHYNEPFADPSAVPTFYLAELARRHVTVALNGDGGDEAFMGYGRYKSMYAISRSDRWPKWLRSLGAGTLGNLPLRGRLASRATTLARLLGPDTRSRPHQYAFTITAFADEHKQLGYGEAMRSYAQCSALDILQPYFAEAAGLVSGANWSDIHVYLPDDLMVKVDIATMAHSLESRSPLLDHSFLEWALTLPEDVTLPRGETKAIFKKAMEPYLPREVLYRPKMGFGCPVDHWFRNELKEMAYDLLLSSAATNRGIVERRAVKALLDEHCSGSQAHHTRLWPLLMMELWFRMWVDPAGHRAQEKAA
jgi:asparagine synthase (glutamine-hydrolysing)